MNYNLTKVNALSANDTEFITQIITLFVTEVPQDLKQVELGIKAKDYDLTYSAAHKIKPSLDLLGIIAAHQGIIEIEAWAKRHGKRKEISGIFERVQNHVDKAIKEIREDFYFEF